MAGSGLYGPALWAELGPVSGSFKVLEPFKSEGTSTGSRTVLDSGSSLILSHLWSCLVLVLFQSTSGPGSGLSLVSLSGTGLTLVLVHVGLSSISSSGSGVQFLPAFEFCLVLAFSDPGPVLVVFQTSPEPGPWW